MTPQIAEFKALNHLSRALLILLVQVYYNQLHNHMSGQASIHILKFQKLDHLKGLLLMNKVHFTDCSCEVRNKTCSSKMQKRI